MYSDAGDDGDGGVVVMVGGGLVVDFLIPSISLIDLAWGCCNIIHFLLNLNFSLSRMGISGFM